MNDSGAAMSSGKVQDGDLLLQVNRVDVTNCPRPVEVCISRGTWYVSLCGDCAHTMVMSKGEGLHLHIRMCDAVRIHYRAINGAHYLYRLYQQPRFECMR